MDVQPVYPVSQSEAESVGSPYFLTGRPCLRGHISPRYTKGGRCSHCQRQAIAARKGRKFNPEVSRHAKTIRRVNAAAKKESTYVPLLPCLHGHSLRWTATGNCVECGNAGKDRHRIAGRFARFKREYGLSKDDYLSLVSKQSSSCAICGKHEPNHFSLHIDHCHKRNVVRGLLCGRCNQGIGLLQESKEIMESAIDYLDRHGT